MIWLSYLYLLVFLLPKTFKLFGFPYFDYERTWWRLFQDRVVRTKFDVNVFITLCMWIGWLDSCWYLPVMIRVFIQKQQLRYYMYI